MSPNIYSFYAAWRALATHARKAGARAEQNPYWTATGRVMTFLETAELPPDWNAMRAKFLRLTEFHSIETGRISGDAALLARQTRLALAIVMNNPVDVHDDELAVVRDASDGKLALPSRPKPRPTPIPDDGETVAIEVTYVWERRGRAGRPRALISGIVAVPLTGVAADKAPVMLRLARPDGGWLDIRKLHGEWLRPVLSPGSWEPIGVAAFADAMRSGAAWRDCPARARTPTPEGGFHAGCLGWLSDFAEPGAPESASERAAASVAADRAIVACAETFAIDGMVWKIAPEPRTTLIHVDDGKDETELWTATWRMGDLFGAETQATITGAMTGARVWLSVPAEGLPIDLPISCESVLRDVEHAMNGSSFPFTPPLASRPDGAPLPARLRDLASVIEAIAAIHESGAPEDKLIDGARLKSSRLEAMAAFAAACMSDDCHGAIKAAGEIKDTADELKLAMKTGHRVCSPIQAISNASAFVATDAGSAFANAVSVAAKTALVNDDILDDQDNIAEAFRP